MLEFTPQEARSLDWQVVDDGVMGGLSKGNLNVSEDGILVFEGKLSLENNGGFSSIRTGNFDKDLSAADGLVARVRGDGRTYQLRLYTDARYRGMRVSFKAEFPTQEGEWTEVKVPFEDFVGSFRGRLLKDAEFDPAAVEGVGLLLADKKAGPFQLKVDWIRSYDGQVKVNDAVLRTADIKASNGIIHVIDSVLLPPKAAKTSAVSPTEQIEKAIDRGVPIFNNGNPGECAKVYRNCMINIAERDDTDARISKAMKSLVAHADQIEDDTERAWALRGGLDKLYAILLNH